MADTDDLDETYTPLGELLAAESWPSDFFAVDDLSFLNTIAYVDGDILDDADGTRAFVNLRVVDEAVFDLPFGTAVVLGGGPIDVSFDGSDTGFVVSVTTDLVRLRLPRDLFVPVVDGPDGPEADPDPDKSIEISIPVGVTFDDQFNFDLSWPEESGRSALALPRCMLGDTGFCDPGAGRDRPPRQPAGSSRRSGRRRAGAGLSRVVHRRGHGRVSVRSLGRHSHRPGDVQELLHRHRRLQRRSGISGGVRRFVPGIIVQADEPGHPVPSEHPDEVPRSKVRCNCRRSNRRRSTSRSAWTSPARSPWTCRALAGWSS